MWMISAASASLNSPARTRNGRLTSCSSAGPKESVSGDLDLEADALERFLEEPGALHFLHAELAEVIERVADQRELCRVALDDVEGDLLALVGLGVSGEAMKRCKDRDHKIALHAKSSHEEFPPPAPVSL